MPHSRLHEMLHRSRFWDVYHQNSSRYCVFLDFRILQSEPNWYRILNLAKWSQLISDWHFDIYSLLDSDSRLNGFLPFCYRAGYTSIQFSQNIFLEGYLILRSKILRSKICLKMVLTLLFYEPLEQTSQELEMLSSVNIYCQVTKIVINPGSQLSILKSVSQMSQVPMIVP